MQRLLNFFSSHPWSVLSGILLISLLAAMAARDVRVHISAEELLVMDDPERSYFEGVRQRFGDDQVILIGIGDDQLLDTQKLETLKSVITRIEALPYVERVESLFSVPHVRSVDGYLKTDPYLSTLPDSPEAAEALTQQALASPFVRHVLLSPDGRFMAVAVVLKDGDTETDDFRLTTDIDGMTAGLKDVYGQVFAIGFPYVRAEIASKLGKEQLELFPVAVGALLITLLVLLRQVVDILVPVLTSAISILWTLGLMGITGIPFNLVTSLVPVLLIIVGSTEDIHLLAEFRRGQKLGLETTAALRHMTRKMGRTVLLTFLTTYLGFMSIGLSGIEVLWQFAIVASTGLMLNFVVTISLIPAVLKLAGHWRFHSRRPIVAEPTMVWSKHYWQWLHRHRWAVMMGMGLFTTVAAMGIPSIELNHNAIDNLARDSRVRGHVETVNRELAGLESFSIVVGSGIEGTFLKVRYLDELVKIQDFVKQHGMSRSTTSFADYLAMLNGVFQELDRPKMPANDDEVYELMIFLDYEHVRGYVSEDYSTARILIRHNISGTHQLQTFIDDLNTFLDTQLDPGLQAHVTGDSVLTLDATRAMINGQLQSIALLLAFVVFIIAVIFTDPKVGLLAALPNAVPVVVLFGVMGFAHIPLNIGTTMAAAIAIGLAVDDTLHFLLRYNRELKLSKSQSRAMQLTIHGEVLPILATSLALMAGFLVFALSDFEPVAQFGILSALVIGTALVADFVATPLLMSSLRLVTLWDLMSSRQRQQIIPKSPLFRDMRPWEIRRFVLSSTLLEFAPGEFVFRRNDPSNEVYLVMKGAVEVSIAKKNAMGGRLVVDHFGSGELFGDVAFLAHVPRHADAVALAPTTLLVLTREALKNTTFLHPLLGSRLCLNLATDVGKRWVRMIERTREEPNEETIHEANEEPFDEDVDLLRPPGDLD